MRLLLAILIASGMATVAYGDSDLVVLGPAASEGTRRELIGHVERALVRAALGKRTEIGPSCAIDIACIQATGAQHGARRALSVSIVRVGKDVTIALVLVDVPTNEQLGKREHALPARKVERELAPLLRKFVDEAPIERAKALFAQGNQHYNLGELAQALELYKRAYQITPLAEFLFNIAQCHRKLGQHQDAITMYQSYLVKIPDAANKALVEDLIAESKAALEAGDRRQIERLAAERARAEELRKAREAEALAAKERRRTEQVKSKRRVFPWLAIGIGAAAIIGGGLLYVTSETDDGSQPTYRDARPAGIGVAIGGGVLAGTGVLWVARF